MRDVVSNLSGLLKQTRSVMDTLRNNLQEIRARIADLKDRRDEIAGLPVALDVAVSRAEEWAEQMVARARQSSPLPRAFSLPPEKWDGRPTWGNGEFGSLAIAYMADAFVAAVKQEVLRAYGDARGISEKERQDLLAGNDAELLAAELAEESLIRAAEAQGMEIDRREDADPRAVLAHDSSLP